MQEAIGISSEQLPEILPVGTAVGTLSAGAASELGLADKTVVVLGGMDQSVGAIGAGNYKPGILSETTGAALTVQATIADALPWSAYGKNWLRMASRRTPLWRLLRGSVLRDPDGERTRDEERREDARALQSCREKQRVFGGGMHPRIAKRRVLHTRRRRLAHFVFEGTKIASLMPCTNFLSAGAIVASAPRNFTRSRSTK